MQLLYPFESQFISAVEGIHITAKQVMIIIVKHCTQYTKTMQKSRDLKGLVEIGLVLSLRLSH